MRPSPYPLPFLAFLVISASVGASFSEDVKTILISKHLLGRAGLASISWLVYYNPGLWALGGLSFKWWFKKWC